MPVKERRLFGRLFNEFEAARDRDPITKRFRSPAANPAETRLGFPDPLEDSGYDGYTRPFADHQYPAYSPQDPEYIRADAIANPAITAEQLSVFAELESRNTAAGERARILTAIAGHQNIDAHLLDRITTDRELLTVRNAAATNPAISAGTLIRFYDEALPVFRAVEQETRQDPTPESRYTLSRHAEHVGLVAEALAHRGAPAHDGRTWQEISEGFGWITATYDLLDY